jgi:hypothetical protein
VGPPRSNMVPPPVLPRPVQDRICPASPEGRAHVPRRLGREHMSRVDPARAHVQRPRRTCPLLMPPREHIQRSHRSEDMSRTLEAHVHWPWRQADAKQICPQTGARNGHVPPDARCRMNGAGWRYPALRGTCPLAMAAPGHKVNMSTRGRQEWACPGVSRAARALPTNGLPHQMDAAAGRRIWFTQNPTRPGKRIDEDHRCSTRGNRPTPPLR